MAFVRLALLGLAVAACSGVVVTATPSPTLAPTMSPVVIYGTPSPPPATPTVAPTPAPTSTVSPSAVATPGVSPTPTPLVLPGYDPGVVYFGTEVDEETLTIPHPASTFGLHQKIFFALYVSQPFGGRTMSIVVVRIEGSEKIVISEDVEIVPSWHQVYNNLRRNAIRRQGNYVMRVYIENNLIANGSFTVS